MKTLVQILAVTSAILASSAVARADDMVYLKSGALLQGTVMEQQPDMSVTMKLADGTVRAIKPGDVKAIEYAPTFAPPAAPTPIASGPHASSETPSSAVTVKLTSTNPDVTLEQILSEGAYSGPYVTVYGSQWRTVCTMPCDKSLDANSRYRVGGTGVYESVPFILPRSAEPVTLYVSAGSAAGHRWGAGLTIFGATAVSIGAAFVGAASLASSGSAGEAANLSSFTTGGAVAAGVGVLMLVSGIALWAGNRTTVATKEGRSLAGAGVHPTATGLALAF